MGSTTILGIVAQGGILGVVLVLVIRGYLVPKPSVDQLRADRDEWHKAYLTSEQARALDEKAMAEQAKSIEVVVALAKTTTQGLFNHAVQPAQPPGVPAVPTSRDGDL